MSVIARLAARLALILGLLVLPAGAGLEAATPKVFPTVTIATPGVSGAAAIAALGNNLPAVAAYYGWTAEELRRKFLSNSGLRVGRTGRLFQSSPVGRQQPVTASVARSASAAQLFSMPWAGGQAPYALDKTFQLHSKPDASKTIYLNFGGQTLTAANHQQVEDLGPASIVVPPFSIDATPAFSDAERRIVQEIWQRVAEDYAPFDVDVTTEPPPPDRITRASADDSDTEDVDENDPVFGIDVLFTPRTAAWECAACGVSGVVTADNTYKAAFYDVGDRYKPSVVFHEASKTVAQDLADRASRAVGTSLGLDYKGSAVGNGTDWYEGLGTSPVNAWAPIMGGLSSRPLRQFSKGEYDQTTNTFDELSVIGEGIGFRADEAGNTTAAAEWLPVVRNVGPSTGSFDGVITSAADIDMFYVKAGAGTFTASVNPAAVGANADLVLTLRNATGGVVPTNNPQVPNPNNPLGNLSASITVANLAAGKYFLEVKGTGEGNPADTNVNAATGYSSYGSVGAYALTTSFAAPAGNTLPSAQFTPLLPSGKGPLVVNFNAATSAAATGSTIVRYQWDFGDGETFESKNSTATHTYPEAPNATQTYSVRLTVTDDTGLTQSASTTVTVEATNPGTPTATIATTPTPARGTAPLRVSFDASPSLQGGSPITSYAWQIGEPAIATLSGRTPPAYEFTKSGTFPVKLTVTNASGSASVTTQVEVINTAPTASFTAAAVAGQVAAPMDVTLNPAASADGDGTITAYRWTVEVPSGFTPITIPDKTTGAAFTQRFDKPGTYTVRLQTTDNSGATSTVFSQAVRVNGAPVADFTPTPGTGLGVSFSAANSTDDGPASELTYSWTFGDGTPATPAAAAATASHTYASAGSYTVTLTVRDAQGATASKSLQVEIGSPTADFTIAPATGTAPLRVSFDASPSLQGGSPITSYAWQIGEPAIATLSGRTPPAYEFTKSGTFPVKLTVTNASGSATIIKQVVVTNTAPTASFTATAVAGQVAAPMDFTLNPAASADGDGTITTYRWTVEVPTGFTPITIPDKTTGAAFTQRFDKAGTYTVKLQTTDNSGATSTVFSQAVRVNGAPVADFTPTPGTGLGVSFSAANSTDDGPASELTYSWTFGDNTPATPAAAAATASHTYASAGSYTVTLTVRDAQGGTASKIHEVTVGGPTATIATTPTPPRGTAPLRVSFDASSSLPGNASPMSAYEWVIHDKSGNVTRTGATHEYTFLKSGTFTVELTVRNNASLTATIIQQVEVINTAPTAGFTATPLAGQVAAPMDVTLDPGISQDADGEITTYRWTVEVPPGANPITIPDKTTGAAFSQRFEKPGTYTVKLQTTDNSGASSTVVMQTIRVNGAPVADFTPTPGTGLGVSFSAANSTDDGPASELTYSWNFGDNTPVTPAAASMTASHTYASAGDYTVTLTVRDAQGATANKSLNIFVGVPVADFTIATDPATGYAPLSVSLDASPSRRGTRDITSYVWQIGSPVFATLSGKSPTPFVFTTSGTYPVTLTISDGVESSTITKQVQVNNAAPSAFFTAAPPSGPAPLSVSFDASGSTDNGQITSYEWDLGNGTTQSGSSLKTVSALYTEAGTYSVRLTVTDNEGLTSDYTTSVVVEPAQQEEGPKIASLTVKLAANRWKRPIARAEVMVVDEAGKPLRKAVVAVQWSGPYARDSWGSTRSNGNASFVTPPLVGKGCYRITVTGLKVAGTSYTPSPEASRELCR